MNADVYQVPTLALLGALVAVFATLYVQHRVWPAQDAGRDPAVQHRHLLWLAGWTLAVIRLVMQISGRGRQGLGAALSETSMQVAALMFVGSLAPHYMRRKPRLPYVVVLAVPLITASLILSLDPSPGRTGQAWMLGCALACLYIAGRWSLERSVLPSWLSLTVVFAIGTGCIWLILRQHYPVVMTLVHTGLLLMTALLFAFTFRRLTAGTVFTVGGLAIWAIRPYARMLLGHGPGVVQVLQITNLMKVIAAAGMIVLVLEDELGRNLASQQRDRRARLEMEKYSRFHLGDMPLREEREQYDSICATIAAVSRFEKAAIFVLTPDHHFRMAGQAGMDGALEGALDAMARRTSAAKTTEIAAGDFFVREVGNLTLMDLSPLMGPGDELRQMSFRKAHVMGIRSREGQLTGALLLAGLRDPMLPLQAEDVLPLELLVARIGAAREQHALLRQLMQSERLAGLGHLAGGVAHELNNPLTAVTGFSELLTDSEDATTREHGQIILNEARRMKQIIDSLVRFRRAAPGARLPISVGVLLRDIQKLMQNDLHAARVEMKLRIAEDLPTVMADGEQIRQVFLQLSKNALASLLESPPGWERNLSVEASRIKDMVQVMFCDSGPGFAEPARAFDPYFTARPSGAGVGLGLSICYSIIREHGGGISAVNLHPHGAAVVIELPVGGSDLPAVSGAGGTSSGAVLAGI